MLFRSYSDFFIDIWQKAASPFITEWQIWGNWILGVFGIFAGMFVGCFAIAIATSVEDAPFKKGLVSVFLSSIRIVISFLSQEWIGTCKTEA